MVQMRVMTSNGHTLVYDTDDVEDIKVSTVSDHTEEVRGGAVHRELTGFTHLNLSIDFKHGKRAVWIDQADAALTDVRTMAAILTEALDAEGVPGPLAGRVFNRFLFGHPDGLQGGPLPHPALEEQRAKTTFGTGPGASSLRAQLMVEFPDLVEPLPPLRDGGLPLVYDLDRVMGDKP